MIDKTYNGWTNYATWRVNLEIFDGSEGPWDHHSAKEFAEEIIFGHIADNAKWTLIEDYARAFLDDVNWMEIADHHNAEVEHE